MMIDFPIHGIAHLPFAVDRNVDAMRVAVIRLKNVAMDIAFARMLVAKISDGINQAPGPIPTLKKERYRERPTMANVDLFLFFPKNEKLVKMQAPHMPEGREGQNKFG
jgi:hypothetical protein